MNSLSMQEIISIFHAHNQPASPSSRCFSPYHEKFDLCEDLISTIPEVLNDEKEFSAKFIEAISHFDQFV